MPFRSLTPDTHGIKWEAYINPSNLITIGKVAELAKRIDPQCDIEVAHTFEACRVTIRSNVDVVSKMIAAYSKGYQ